MEKNIEIKLAEGQKELVLRTGEAETIVPRRKGFAVEGTIGVPLEFLERPPNFFTKPYEEGGEDASVNYSHVLVDRDKMTIALVEEAGSEDECTYLGKLLLNPDFKRFGVNDNSVSYTPLELAEKIKMSRSFFESKTIAMKLVSELRGFEAKVNKEVEAKADERANRRVLLAQTVTTNIPEGFKMKLPIFKGGDEIVFEVEIGIDPVDLSCRLISPDANDIINETKNEIIDGQVAAMRELHQQLRIYEI